MLERLVQLGLDSLLEPRRVLDPKLIDSTGQFLLELRHLVSHDLVQVALHGKRSGDTNTPGFEDRHVAYLELLVRDAEVVVARGIAWADVA